jgi:hypothetical protein
MASETRRWDLAVLVPMVILIIMAVIFWHAEVAINDAMLESKKVEIHNEVDMMAVGASVAPNLCDYQSSLESMVAHLDARPLIFAGAYSQVDGQSLELFTDRDNATTFDPTEYDEFQYSIKGAESGWVMIGFTPDGGVYRDMHLYWRWLDDSSDTGDRYLIVAAVSKFSITVQVARWATIAPFASILVTFLLDVWLAIFLIRLGYVHGMRNDDGDKKKWRSYEGRR